MRILLIDDSETIRHIEAEQLLSTGHSDVLTAENGFEGLTKLEQNMPVDLVLLDINMPGMSGIDVLKTNRTSDKYNNVRVVMVTTESEKERVLEALRAGADDYIVKPFDAAELKKRMGI